MSTQVAVFEASIPAPEATLEGHQKTLMGLKQNLEVHHGVRKPSNIRGPTTVNVQTNATLRKVQATYP